MRRFLVLFAVVGCSSATAPWNPGGHADSGAPGSGDAGTTQAEASTAPDAGTADAATADADYNTAVVCTSGQMWTLGDTKSPEMHPGVACRKCHVTLGSGKKDFDISGTVYPTAHEPDDCDGVAGVQVVITDANNAQHVLSVNAAGNFYNDDLYGLLKIPVPYTAKVVSGSNTREMLTAQTSGDCNSCHTESGAQSAPGRIMAP
jgi:hypothetical protein